MKKFMPLIKRSRRASEGCYCIRVTPGASCVCVFVRWCVFICGPGGRGVMGVMGEGAFWEEGNGR